MDTQVIELLDRIRDGDSSAGEELMPLVYAELHRIAVGRLQKERVGHTLQPTALVNEAYLRMFGKSAPHLANKAHFLAVASQTMRRVLVDHARARSTEKRGGDFQRVEPGPAIEFHGMEARPVDMLALDMAIDELAAENAQLAQAVELFYFGGLTAEEAAVATGRSVHSFRHDLRFAQAWLRRKLAGEG